MKNDGMLYQSCVEPQFQHTADVSNPYFPPLIALCNVQDDNYDALERQIWRHWASYPANVKESIVLEDLINVLCGSDGTLFGVEKGSYKMRCSPIIDLNNDVTLYTMATEVLELAIMQRKVQDFVNSNDRGFVALSFCEVINVLLQELQGRITQFDRSHRKGAMSLQMFKLSLQPALHTFEVLTMITSNGNMTGAALVNVLTSVNDMFGTGDPRRSLVNHLMKQAFESYCYMVDPWVHFGELYDPCQEFFVVQNRRDVIQKGTQEFTIDWIRVPEVIKDVAQIILDTGYYVRILSNSRRKLTFEDQRLHAKNAEEFKEKVIALNQYVSGELMRYIIVECNLMDVLESVHRFYLMARGDYVSILLADSSDIHESTNLRFHEAVALSSLRNDEYRQKYSMEFGREAGSGEGAMAYSQDSVKVVGLYFKIEWPLKMFFNDNILNKYQCVFGFLFQLKQTINALSRIWLSHMKWKGLPLAPSSQPRLNFTFVCIERMLFLCRNLEYMCTIEVTERNYNMMLQAYEGYISNAKVQQTFTSIAKDHEQFIGKVVEQCMMDDREIFPSVQRAVSICSVFATQVLTFLDQWYAASRGTADGTGTVRLQRGAKLTSELLQNPGYIAMIGSAYRQFEKHTSSLMTLLGKSEEHSEGSLFLRLTYNGFYR
ncbi:gamma tubulin complex like protein [Babesia gibsoni]|uniref:Spindle pole body component n=1 Tax=Babesia gibsoni TaxID=33632 RepID=A0AAD8LRY9_BABGI|nr:gamma tubulin complex like protein [Babesia gibsoni]